MFVEYQAERDCLFFLGAGASYSDGVPLQRDIIPEILCPKDSAFEASALRKEVSAFITNNFSFSNEINNYPSLEVVFSFIDYFLENETALDGDYTLDKLRALKELLIKLVYFTTSKALKKPMAPFEREKGDRSADSVYSFLWEKAVTTNRNFSIITTNYDNQIDDSFDVWLYAQHGLIDYCIDFMNYTKEKGLIGFDWWVNPREPIPDWQDCDPVPIKLIKLHGSLNWKYCQACQQPILTPWNKHIDLDTGGLARFDPSWLGPFDEKNQLCPRDGHPLSTLIVPPTFSKTLRHPVVQNLIYEAQKEIRISKKVVFVGYSFPDADVHIRAMFLKNMKKDTEVIVVNPGLTESARNTYRALSSSVEFIDAGFQEALEQGLMERVVETRT